MKKIFKKKSWIAVVAVVAIILTGMYFPFRSNYEQTLQALVFKCDENGVVVEDMAIDEITIKVDTNRHKFLLSDRQTVNGRLEFSAYYKEETRREENVAFVLESRYSKPLADNQNVAKAPIEGDDQTRAEETKSESGKYLICNQIYYEDNNAYEYGLAYREPEHIPIYREMIYSEEFDQMIWTDYENGYVYVCAVDKVDVASVRVYFDVI